MGSSELENAIIGDLVYLAETSAVDILTTSECGVRDT